MQYKIIYVHVENSPFMPGHIVKILPADHRVGYMEQGGKPGSPSCMNTVSVEISEAQIQDIKEGLCIVNHQTKKLEHKVDIHNRMKFLVTQESPIIEGQLTAEAQAEMDTLKIIEKDIRITARMQRIR